VPQLQLLTKVTALSKHFVDFADLTSGSSSVKWHMFWP
jgi:hypothetical protein